MTCNVATAVTKTFKVDKTAPELKVSAVNSKNSVVNEYETVGGSSVNNTDYVDMNIEVTESFFASNKVNISVQKDGEDVSSSYFTNFGSNEARDLMRMVYIPLQLQQKMHLETRQMITTWYLR